jgi:hypothetical protein
MSRDGKVTKESLRNLIQYKDLSDEEFEKVFQDLKNKELKSQVDYFERFEKKKQEFSQDYEVKDLKYNDKETFNSLINALLTLEDLENLSLNIRSQEEVKPTDLTTLKKVTDMISRVRGDVSDMQDDLKISRKIRKGSKEETVHKTIENLKQKAEEFYKSRMSYIFCPKCKMLLCTAWFLYPDEEENKVKLICNRELEDGEICGNEVIVSSKELVENNNKNIEGVRT